MSREWSMRCNNCPMLRTALTSKPKVGAFHWSVDGRCEATPEVYVRKVGKWERVDIEPAA